MNPKHTLQHAYDDALRKAGRNLLLFQQAGRSLKHLLTLGGVTLPPGADEDNLAALADTYVRHATRQAIGDGMNLFQQGSPPDTLSADEAVEGRPNFPASFDEHPAAPEQVFSDLIAQHEKLVHQLIPLIDPTSVESCLRLGAFLDEQEEQVLPVVRHLQQDLIELREKIEFLLNTLKTPIGTENKHLSAIQCSPLIRNLAAIARENPDPGAWTPLSEATQRLQDFPVEKIDDHLAQFDHESLTQLLISSQLFDIHLELTRNGRQRVFYRLRDASAQ